MGLLLSAFFWTYAMFQIVSGWLVDRYDVRWVFGPGLPAVVGRNVRDGARQRVCGPVRDAASAGNRGIVAYPSYSKIITGNFPQTHRGIAKRGRRRGQ